ncbi:integral membrane protein [Venturia nashicola]|uniref:Integral membrane protein n=1 Tax=Venturia nashicola TaxID=86259 RepID=A0A4Z1PFL3_9PEZI|nr:integral membrane protein [Venturia nashicola]
MSWCYYHPGRCSNAQYGGSNAQYGGYYGGYSGGYSGSNNGGNGRGNGPLGDGNGGFNSISSFLGFDINKAEAIRLAHGVIACLAWVIFFPLGAIFIRILPGRLALVMHALFQLFAYILYIIAFALGCWMASHIRFGGFFNFYENYHPIIGIVVFAFLFFQPILGILHHSGFKKTGGRSFVSYLHLWLGRILITLGIINGGLGLMLAGNVGRRTYIAYGVVAGFFWLLWVLAACIGAYRRRKHVPVAPRHASGGSTPTRRGDGREFKPSAYA